MRTLEEMGDEGKRKMDAMEPTMVANYDAAKPDMIKNFGLQPFGPRRTKNYNDAMDRAKFKVDSDRWKDKWQEAMKK